MGKMKRVTPIKCLVVNVIIMLSILVMTNCSEPIGIPQFQKTLVFSDDHEISFTFDVDKTWDKEIQNIDALADEGNVSLDFNEAEDVEQQGRTVRKKITCYLENNTATRGKECSFRKILVKWNDGSEQIAEIGDITITSERTNEKCKHLILEESDRQRVQIDEYETITLEESRLLFELKDVYEDILINGVSIFDSTEDLNTATKNRTRIEGEAMINTLTCPYSLIDVNLTIICKSKDEKKQYVSLKLVVMRDE